jgi:hypothetical protein
VSKIVFSSQVRDALSVLLSAAHGKSEFRIPPSNASEHNPDHFGWTSIANSFKVNLVAPPDTTHPITVVTAYFQVASKFSHSQYQAWIPAFLNSVSAPLVIFTTIDQVEFLRKIRGDRVTTYVTFKSIWDIPQAKHFQSVFQRHHALGPARFKFSPELHAVWWIKPWFVAAVANQNPYASQYFIWTDIGSFREREFADWPSVNAVEKTFSACPLKRSCIVLSQVNPTLQKARATPDKLHFSFIGVQGGMFMTTRSSALWWWVEYLELFHEYITRGVFIGKEEFLLNHLALRNWWRVVWLSSYEGKNCGDDRWFAFQYFLDNSIGDNPCKIPIKKFHAETEYYAESAMDT